MKRVLLLLLTLTLSGKVFCITDKVKIGLSVSPGLTWAKPFGKEMKSGGVRFGVNYGLGVEYWFAENFGLSTGVGGAMEGGNLTGRKFFEVTDTSGNVLRTVKEKYTLHSLVIPIGIKLRTNDIKNFRIYGEVGFENYFTVSARATYDNPVYLFASSNEISIEKENVLRKDNDVAKSLPDFRINFYDIRIAVGGGFEYHFNDKVAVFSGIYYHNGFLNYVKDNAVDTKKEPTVLRSLNLKIGVLF
ncbi:MAG: porin family protein [Chitinophagales bacterium]